MPRKSQPSTAEQKAYSRGYTAGRNRERKANVNALNALRQQAEEWRARYIALRDYVPQADDAVDPVGELAERDSPTRV